jgi:large subunit ribosomal protein L30
MTTKRIRVTQTGSPIGRHRRQRANLVGLGLNKIRRSKIWPDTPEVRGRIDQVHHLVQVDPVDEEATPQSAGKQRSTAAAREERRQPDEA